MKITKATLDEIANGNYDSLLGAIDNLIDHYNSDQFISGYNSAMDDLCIHAWRIAKKLEKKAGKVKDNYLTVDETATIITEYVEKETMYRKNEHS
jgi:hypothetical protein